MSLFAPGCVVCYPTDTSFGLGARCDDVLGLRRVYTLKQREQSKSLSLLCRDWAMLCHYAQVPPGLTPEWFLQSPRTALLRPTTALPASFAWPADCVGFRLNPLPEIAHLLPDVPITATSANVSGQPSIYAIDDAQVVFGNTIGYITELPHLTPKPASTLWDWRDGTPLHVAR